MCVAGKTVTVVVPDELQPGQVLAVRPRPALLPLASAPHPPAAAVMGGPPCSHPCPCPALRLPPKRKERLHLLCSLYLLFSGHCAAQAQGEAERHRSAAAAAVYQIPNTEHMAYRLVRTLVYKRGVGIRETVWVESTHTNTHKHTQTHNHCVSVGSSAPGRAWGHQKVRQGKQGRAGHQ